MDEGKSDGEGLFNFAFEQFEYHRTNNPEITKAIDEFCSHAERNESAPVMFPIFYSIRKLGEDGVQVPHISEKSAKQAKDEFREAGKDILELPVFTEFSGAIRAFLFFLDILVKVEETKLRAKILFAIILRMIQIEKTNRNSKS